MKKILFAAFMLLCVVCTAQTKEYVLNGKEFSAVQVKSQEKYKNTGYTWRDSKGNTYPIYITQKGACFIIRTSSKTGKEYRQYMAKEISQQIVGSK